MRQLHVVAVSEDGRHVLLAGRAGAVSGGFQLALDDRLAAAVRGDLTRPGESPPGSDLTPREIQTRLRSGESVESIALAAGVPVARVERFSGPVQGEMARIIEEARSCYLVRGRLGASAVPMGAAVDEALGVTLAAPSDGSEWSARREDIGTWVVTVTWFARARTRTASWRYDPAAKALAAFDPASAALGHRDSDAPAPRPQPKPKPRPKVKTTPTAKAKPKAKTKTKPQSARRTAKAAPVKAATKATAKVPAKVPAKASAKARGKAGAQPAAKATSPKRQPASKAVSARAGAPRTASRALRVVPDHEPSKRPTTAARKSTLVSKASQPTSQPTKAKGRASVPGWADVLLGTSPGPDR